MRLITQFWVEYQRMLVLNVVVVLVMTGMGMVGPMLPLLGRSLGINTAMVGFLITSFGLARMFLNIPAGFLAERHGRRPLLIAGPLCINRWLGLLCPFHGVLAAGLKPFPPGFGSSLYTTSAMTAVIDLSPETKVSRQAGVKALNRDSTEKSAPFTPSPAGLLRNPNFLMEALYVFSLRGLGMTGGEGIFGVEEVHCTKSCVAHGVIAGKAWASEYTAERIREIEELKT